jgi:hypothetical protein
MKIEKEIEKIIEVEKYCNDLKKKAMLFNKPTIAYNYIKIADDILNIIRGDDVKS